MTRPSSLEGSRNQLHPLKRGWYITWPYPTSSETDVLYLVPPWSSNFHTNTLTHTHPHTHTHTHPHTHAHTHTHTHTAHSPLPPSPTPLCSSLQRRPAPDPCLQSGIVPPGAQTWSLVYHWSNSLVCHYIVSSIHYFMCLYYLYICVVSSIHVYTVYIYV